MDGPADPRSDVYALGVVADECLTEALPINGQSVVSLLGSTSTSCPFRSASTRPGPGSPETEALILEMMAKSPDHRPADGQALRARLEALKESRRTTGADAMATLFSPELALGAERSLGQEHRQTSLHDGTAPGRALEVYPTIRLLAAVQMSNHLHLVVEGTAGVLDRFMCQFLGALAKAVNELDGVSGQAYERANCAIGILDDNALLNRVAYTLTVSFRERCLGIGGRGSGWLAVG